MTTIGIFLEAFSCRTFGGTAFPLSKKALCNAFFQDVYKRQALTEMDMDKAKDKWVEAQKQVNEDVSALPVYGNTYFDFYNKKIKNLKTSALYQWTHGLRDATIE